MAFNNNQQAPFWEFVRSMQNSGAGVDHPSQAYNPWASATEGPPYQGSPFPFGDLFGGHFGGPGATSRGRFGHRGRRCGRRDGSRNRSAHGERSRSPRREGEQAENEGREGGPHHHGRRGNRRSGEGQSGEENSDTEAREHSPRPHGGRHHGRHGPGGFGGRGRGGWGSRGGWGGPHGHHHLHPPPPPFGGPGGPFDLSALIESLSAHPLAQAFRGYSEQNGFGAPDAQRSGETLVPEDADMENSFVPPIDVFTTENAYVLHVALPGAKKEDVGVHWDAEKGTLTMAGVVYRQGDEKFLESLTKKERKVGAFERTMKLPLNAEDKDEIDGDNITAKLEDGVLVVTVPKVEKEESWTEIKRVEIE
ncbi:HSP20-like chaperone protein [Rutstroemia sp. NJR-2017a BVV2]|nr:HSP20-like chaperone protein [Rutstroemia sp. NJR-2017a BVV2]